MSKIIISLKILPIVITIVVLVLGSWSYITVENSIQKDIAKSLSTILQAEETALSLWYENQRKTVETWASHSLVRNAIQDQLESAKFGDQSSEFLSSTEQLKLLRNVLQPVCEEYNFIGFVVVDRDGYNIAALLDEPIGQRNLIDQPNFINRVLLGNSLVTKPFLSKISLPDINGEFKENRPTMFSASPVLDESGIIIAALLFRIRPEIGFSQIFSVGRSGESGETYAFDRNGLMLSDSRFNHDLRKLGVIPDHPDSNSILNIQIRDPGSNMVEGFVPQIDRSIMPLTKMASVAISGVADIDAYGYRDYRGVTVVGAWTWMKNLDIGLVTEIDYDEAYSGLAPLRIVFGSLIVFLIFISIGTVILEHKNKKKSKRILEAEDLLKTIISSLVEGVIIINERGIIQSINQSVENLFGYTESEILGKNVTILIPSPDKENHESYLRKYLQTGEQKIIGIGREVSGLRKDGSLFPLYLSVSQSKSEEGFLFTGILRDLTEEKEIANRLQKSLKAAKEASNAKSDFLANMSHELRTPLNSILGFSQIILDDEISDEQRDFMGMIKNSSDILLDLINNILDLSKVEADQLDLEAIDCDVESIVYDCCDAVRSRIASNQLEILVDIGEVHSNIIGDPTRIRQILINLLSNAVKFTERGEIIISLQPVSEGETTTKLEFSVFDTGIGMTNEQKNMVFAPFKQADSSTTRKYGGTGLGLSISKKLTELMGGSLHVESDIGKGSKFYFQLTFDKIQEVSPANDKLATENIENVTCLIVDDNNEALRITEKIVSDIGLNPILAKNADEGLEQFKNNPEIKIIFLDIVMPTTDGFKFIDQVKHQFPNRSLKIIMVTADMSVLNIRKLKESNIDGYLFKPLRQSSLTSVLQSLFAGDKKGDHYTDENSAQKENFAAKVLVVEDNIVNQKVAGKMMQRMGHHVEFASDGLKAIEMVTDNKFDIIFMDMQMPNLGGIDATRKIRDLGIKTPVIAMTANAMKGDRENCLEAGMDDYISKPISKIVIKEKILKFSN